MIYSSKIMSPKLINLQEELKKGNNKALDEFWEEVRIKGTPLIETIENSTSHKLVTFVMREENDIKNYVMISGFASEDLTQNIFEKLENSNVYYKSYKLFNETRITYYLSKNNPLEPRMLWENYSEHKNTYISDPLSSKTFIYPDDESVDDDKKFIKPLIEMEDTFKNTWIEPKINVPKGKLNETKIYSQILNNERKVWVYTPPGYSEKNTPYHCVVLFDGEDNVSIIPTPTILDNLISENKIFPVVGVFIDNIDMETRNRELTCYGPFADFIATELMAWLRENYNITDNPEKIVVGGNSFGGLASSFIGFKYPKVFGNVLSISGSYWWVPVGEEEKEWLIREFVKSGKLALKFYINVGKYDNPNKHIIPNRHLRDILECKGYSYYYNEYPGGHEPLHWRDVLPDGLMKLIGY